MPLNGFEVAQPAMELVSKFLSSRREGLSPRIIEFYDGYLNRARDVVGLKVTCQSINEFLKSRQCSGGGKHAYYRTLKTFYNWLYSPKSGYKLNPSQNPMLGVDAPKEEKRILSSLTREQVDFVIEQAGCVRDKAIVSLFVDSGLRLAELTNINPHNIDWANRLIKVKVKGGKEGLALFGSKTESLLREWLEKYPADGKLWDLRYGGISDMLQRLSAKTGIAFTAHTLRRTFASILAKRGVDALHIMRLGRWDSLDMVERYTKSVRFQDSMRFYTAIVS